MVHDRIARFRAFLGKEADVATKKTTSKKGAAKKAAKKIVVKAPTKKEVTDAAKQLPKGHSSAGRVMREREAALNKGKRKGK